MLYWSLSVQEMGMWNTCLSCFSVFVELSVNSNSQYIPLVLGWCCRVMLWRQHYDCWGAIIIMSEIIILHLQVGLKWDLPCYVIHWKSVEVVKKKKSNQKINCQGLSTQTCFHALLEHFSTFSNLQRPLWL